MCYFACFSQGYQFGMVQFHSTRITVKPHEKLRWTCQQQWNHEPWGNSQRHSRGHSASSCHLVVGLFKAFLFYFNVFRQWRRGDYFSKLSKPLHQKYCLYSISKIRLCSWNPFSPITYYQKLQTNCLSSLAEWNLSFGLLSVFFRTEWLSEPLSYYISKGFILIELVKHCAYILAKRICFSPHHLPEEWVEVAIAVSGDSVSLTTVM